MKDWCWQWRRKINEASGKYIRSDLYDRNAGGDVNSDDADDENNGLGDEDSWFHPMKVGPDFMGFKCEKSAGANDGIGAR